jgi:TetR/AcrR family transcriptional regulator
MPNTKAKPVVNTRIQARNKELILEAALDVFSASGFRGATVDQIAAKAEMSKPNLLYYFRRKEDIYVALLEHTLSDWLKPLRELDPAGDPLTELARYISAKMQMSAASPKASRLFANEILHGAPMIEKFLKGPLRQLVAEKSLVIQSWIAAGKIAPVDPYHLIFAIWAVTQHYADFAVQVEAVIGHKATPASVRQAVCQILLQGITRDTKASSGINSE